MMAALEVTDPGAFNAAAFDAFLAEQPDLGTKWAPRFVRISRSLPVTETSKVLKRKLRSERWESDEPIWFRPGKGSGFRLLEAEDRAAIRAAFAARGREAQLI